MFITFEGPEGSGKTTQIRQLATFLEEQDYSVYTTREPGGTAIGDQIRKVLLDHANREMLPRTEILLFLASRAQHTAQVIRPKLEAGTIVLCDRYRDSTVAYQGYGHITDIETLHYLNDFATGGLVPDLTILLDLPVETGIRRREEDGDWNRLDAQQVAFHDRVRQGFHDMAAAEPRRWRIVDASQDIETVQQEIRRVVSGRLEVPR